MTDPCKRHNDQSTGYLVRMVSRGNGRVAAKWKVFELFRCLKCGEEAHRVLGEARADDEREAARVCGVPAHDVEKIPVAARKSAAIEVKLTAWPFPCSAHVEPT